MAFQPTSNGVTNDSNTRTLLLDYNGTSSYSPSGLPSSFSSSSPPQQTIIPIRLPLPEYDPNVSYAIIIPRSAATGGTSLYSSTSVLGTTLPDALVPIPVADGGSDSQFDAYMSQFDAPVGNLNQTTNVEVPTNAANVGLSRHLMSDAGSNATTATAIGTNYEREPFPILTNDVYDASQETTSYTPVPPTTTTTTGYGDGDREEISIASPTTTFGTTSPYHTATMGSRTGASNHTTVESNGRSESCTARERRGNSGASARFRERRREREKYTAAALEKARGELQELGIRIQELKAENKLLREILSMNKRQKSEN